LSKIISKRRYVGIICLVIGIVATMSVFSYLSFYSNINFGIVGSKFLANNPHDLVNHPVSQNNSGSNLDDSTSSILVAFWIGLMIFGSYLLFHIHFKVLPKE
jgi:hypothetical protein